MGGSSVSDFVDANGVRGLFQLEHCVYQRTGLPCRRCQRPIRRMVLAGRGRTTARTASINAGFYAL